MKWSKWTAAHQRQAERLAAEGFSRKKIGHVLGVSHSTVQRHLDPEAAVKATQRERVRKSGRVRKPPPREEERRLARARSHRVRPDRRDLTGIVFGDPQPERSALKRRI